MAEKLRKHYSRPYFLPEKSENAATDWIFMGGPGLGAHMHVKTEFYLEYLKIVLAILFSVFQNKRLIMFVYHLGKHKLKVPKNGYWHHHQNATINVHF